ncbi:TIGR03943 family putative permease subunit [Cohnella yongneupensis]|uniref:TIGR03943 family putative permease subunit n=1 Tax=Cohnella yongneupensis TaxID=425006 RepID=A0ABW0R2W1_9BACL
MHAKHSIQMASHYFIRSFILAAFAYFIVVLVRTDNLDLYIATRMQFIVKLTALGMYVIAAQQLYAGIRSWANHTHHSHACCDDHSHDLPNSWRASLLLYGWFLLPLVLALAVPDGMLGSAMAAAKGVQYSPEQVVMPESPSSPFLQRFAKYGQQLIKQNPIGISDERFIETLTTLDLYRTAFIGKTIRLSGFVFREKGMNNHQFSATRFAVSCCSADAYPYGILINYGKAYLLESNEWVSVTGKLSTTNYNGKEIIEIDANVIQRIHIPDDPYVSPDIDFESE